MKFKLILAALMVVGCCQSPSRAESPHHWYYGRLNSEMCVPYPGIDWTHGPTRLRHVMVKSATLAEIKSAIEASGVRLAFDRRMPGDVVAFRFVDATAPGELVLFPDRRLCRDVMFALYGAGND